ncbi:major capsid protein [Aeromonas aquatica]|uniref:major capsid protein n=1 Tax=Aeromonas aquatica TaxID=558964 RepID=UPI00051B1F7A|nr:major capsid protein [Aeromonas aquatica]
MSVQAAMESEKFGIKNLTASINKTKVPKCRLAELGVFSEKGVTTTHVDVEHKAGKLQIVTDKERGEEGDKAERGDRDVITVRAVHLPLVGEIVADDLQGVRAFGQEYANDDGGERFQEVIDEHFTDKRLSLDITIESLRFGALKGKVIGKSGRTLVDFFKEFGLNEADAQHEIDFSAPKGVRNQIAEVLRKSKENQDGVPARRYRGFASPEFMDKLMEDPSFVKAYERFQDGKALREDVRGGIDWDGILWEEHNEKMPDGTRYVSEGTALVFPEDNRGLFLTRFAPANYNETVNTVGLPYYARVEPKKFNKGLDTESQSNPINICTSPLAVRQLSIKGMVASESKASK